MSKLSVLQLGDIHLPQFKDERHVDIKDKAVSRGLISELSIPKISAVFREILRVRDREKPQCTLICGDLSSRGSLPGYVDCVIHLIKWLKLTSVDSGKLHVVPGNHDIDRKLCTDRSELNLTNKLSPLGKAWSDHGINALVETGVRRTTHVESGRQLSVFSLNSCIGCGEWQVLPAPIRTELGKLLDQMHSSASDGAFDLVGEQLDTPMFLASDVEELQIAISDAPQHASSIILSHHNLLPQAMTRVDLYTEMINSGAMRTMITRHNRPIVYCHGHIHTDPIEVISDGRFRGSQLIAVSAPLITQGFNLLTFHYDRNNHPVGLTVDFYRLQENASVVLDETVRIPLRTDGIDRIPDVDIVWLLQILDLKPQRFSDLQKRFNEKRDKSANANTMQSILLEAEWASLIEIRNRGESPQKWIVQRQCP